MWKRRRAAAGPTAAPLSDHNPTSAGSPLAGWSDARKRAYALLDSNPNAYYYRFNAPGEMPRYGPWSEEEKKLFLSKLAESEGEVKQWGLFSRSIPGRVGYQCSNYYRLLVQRGELQSSSYVKDDEGQIHYVGKQSGNGRRGGPNKGCPMTHGLATQPHTSAYSSDPLFHGTGKKPQSKKKQSNKKCKPRGIQPKEALSSVVFPSSSESLADERQAASLNGCHLHSHNGGRLIETQQQTSFLKKMVTVEHLPPQNFIHLTFKETSGNQSDFAGSHIPISHLELCCLCGSSGIGKDQACLLWCHECSECYHSYCLSTELRLHGDKKRHWRCPDCKVCEVCKDPGDEDRLLVCERCDDGFHTFCLQPPLLEIPSGTWYCDSCADNPPAVVTESSDTDFDRLPQRMYARDEDKRSAPKAHLHATNRLLEQPRISMTREQQRQFEGLLFDLYEMQAQIASLDYRSDLAGLNYEEAEPFGKNDRAVEERENEAEATLKQDVDQRPVLEDRCCFCCSCCPDAPLLAPPVFAIGKNDSRECTFCGQRGDCMPCQEGRLLPLTTDKWCHVNCARWSSEVYACPDGGLVNVEKAAMRGRNMRCSHCGNKGATIGCAVAKCSKTYHFMCARQAGCLFLSNNCTFCAEDAQTRSTQSLLDAFAPLLPRQQALFRRVYVLRKTKVLATSLPDDDTLLELKKEDPTLFSENGTIPYSVASQPLVYERRVGGLTLSFLGIIVYEYPAFHSDTTLYPVGFKSIRTFWSMTQPWKKCAYTNEIHFDRRNNSPVFIVTPLDGDNAVVASSPAEAWGKIVYAVQQQQENTEQNVITNSIAEHYFGLSAPWVKQRFEYLENATRCRRYQFQYRDVTQITSMLPTPNVNGCARCIAFLKGKQKETKYLYGQPISSFMARMEKVRQEYTAALVHSDHALSIPTTIEYKKLQSKQRRLRVYRSNIHDWGVFTLEPIKPNEMIVEYVGEIIRQKVADEREAQYFKRGIGTYMFRLDDDLIVDATMKGNISRMMNHCCEPNAIARLVKIDGEPHIILYAAQYIAPMQEITYDYNFPIEDIKIPCYCGASSCRGFLN